MLHIALHFIVPALIAAVFFRARWTLVFLILSATILVDIDHLLATPIYDPNRCSINFHPLHQFIPIWVYALMCLIPFTRLVGAGLLIHMGLDSIDCYHNTGFWYTP